MNKKHDTIGEVHVICKGEQIAFVVADSGNYLVTPIPDASVDTLADVNVLATIDGGLKEALRRFDHMYGLN